MKKVDVYNSDYTNLNHAYILIYDTYEKLIQCKDADNDVLLTMESILRVFNPALDRIKSEMTVQTRYKDGSSAGEVLTGKQDKSKGKGESKKEGKPNILHGKFGDD